MIYLIAPDHNLDALEIVRAALVRSFTSGIVRVVSFDALNTDDTIDLQAHCFVVINPLDSWTDRLITLIQTNADKLLLLGLIPNQLARYLGMNSKPLAYELKDRLICEPAKANHTSESNLKVVYQKPLGDYTSPLKERPFVRYDFMEEWNNLGFGAILVDESIWSMSNVVTVPESTLMASVVDVDTQLGAYAALWTEHKTSVLWFNRAVGPVDSQEWALVEHFFANFQYATQACVPYVSEIPYGYDAAVTMRLDCDEDVESARPLWQAYQAMGVPFSLALHTKVLSESKHHALPRDVLSAGGAVLSHTATHAPDWGGSYQAALVEGQESKALIKACIDYEVRYAVSPFHQTPSYARQALAEVGYQGCIGGIICNDPDFLMARSGVPPWMQQPTLIGHSQQCMLHGDCMLADDDPLDIFKQAFSAAYRAQTFFGYLDHPFSVRYQYGWTDEAQRIFAHQDFVQYIKSYDNVLFANTSDAMDFLLSKSTVMTKHDSTGFSISPGQKQAKWTVAVTYQGQQYALSEQGLNL